MRNLVRRVDIIAIVIRFYFVVALGFSARHLVNAAEKAGGHGLEALVTPLIIDGLFVFGAALRSAKWSADTRRTGLWIQTAAGVASIAGNVYAADSAFGVGFGAALPLLLVLSEWLGGRVKTAARVAEDKAAQDAADRKAAGYAKGQATKQRRKTEADQVARAAERLTRQAARHAVDA